jgi:RNA polymerase sigma-70 factor, ECF subfamily
MRSDEALLAALRRRDATAFDELYARHERHLFGFVHAHLKDRAESEDVLHEAFLAVLSSTPANVQSVRAWLYTIARNACLNRLRTRRRASAALTALAPPEAAQPHDALEAHQNKAALSVAVDALPDELQQLFHLRTRGLSYLELADVLELPLGTIKSRLHEVVRRLRETMHHDL